MYIWDGVHICVASYDTERSIVSPTDCGQYRQEREEGKFHHLVLNQIVIITKTH